MEERAMQTKAYKGMGMEGRIANWYAKATRNDTNEFKALAKRMSEGLAEGPSLREVAPGPGYFALELAKLGNYKITGLESGSCAGSPSRILQIRSAR
jgi:hypothetical protein